MSHIIKTYCIKSFNKSFNNLVNKNYNVQIRNISDYIQYKSFKPEKYAEQLGITNYGQNRYINNEKIFMMKDFNYDKVFNYLDKVPISVLGYGPQGRSQALNMLNNGLNVSLGIRKNGESYKKAKADGWLENENLFDIEEAASRGRIIKYLLSDTGQIENWDLIKPHLTKNKTLYFSHGFGITYKHLTHIVPPDNIDVIMVAPKGAGISVREKFLDGKGINCSFAIHQDYTGDAKTKCLALGYSFGCDLAYETTFDKETYSDLTGERCVLMGLIQGAFKAQYDILIERGHSSLEAYNETVEEALVSLYPLINEQGMDWLYKNCSTTAQVGALKWAPEFEKVLKPVIKKCYDSVSNGKEVKDVIESNTDKDYRKKLDDMLNKMSKQELWITKKKIDAMQNNKTLNGI